MSARHAGIPLKKRFGQHFLRDKKVVEYMLGHVSLSEDSSVFEIGCGDGFLTKMILQNPCARLWVFEIDQSWADYVNKVLTDHRLTVFHENILDVSFEKFQSHAPWILLSNLPYQIVFPLLHRLQKYRHLLKEGVVMMQEEVAQKLIAKGGRGYGYPALFFQHYFNIKLLVKIAPTAFYPPPKVYSRLVYLKPKALTTTIPDEQNFWKFIKVIFRQPRRTIRNNLKQAHYTIDALSEELLALRAQQLSMSQLVSIWNAIRE